MQYDNLSKEELLKLIKKQELDLKSKKYRLFWDDEKEPEQVVLDCRDNLPVLRRIKSKEIKEPKNNTGEDNILIEGDNYHALTVLNYTHQEKIDVIYIDPPYNTGNKDFIYNDNYVDKEDGYRHSKWLNFMDKRLKLAKELLKKDGVIFVSIDDHEQAQLKLLCDSIFGENNFIDSIIWKKTENIKMDSKFLSQNKDYILSYRKSDQIIEFAKEQSTIDRFKLKDEKGSYYLRKLDSLSSSYSKGMDYIIEYGGIKYYAGGSKSKYKQRQKQNPGKKAPTWLWSKSKFEQGLINGEIIFKNGNVYNKVRYDGLAKKPFVNIQKIVSQQTAQKELEMMFNKRIFDHPKPPQLIKWLINLIKDNKNSIILDFFAWSGTTAQAVLELNKEDGGNRKFILCTNNENNICTEITYPRIEKVIKGYDFKGKDKTILFEKKLTWTDLSKKISSILEEVNNLIENKKEEYDEIKKEFKDNTLKIIGIKNIDGKKEGLGGNLQYFKTSLIQTTKNRDQTKINLTQKCTQMLCLKENIFNSEIEKEDFKIFSSNKKDKFLCVYYNFIEESFEEFLKEIKKLKGKKIIYMFSLEDKIDKSLFKEIKNCKLEAIPKKILEIYKKLVKMNIPIKVETIFIDLEKAKKQIFEDKDKDTGAKTLRVVLEKLVQKIAQKNQINILTDKGKEIKLSTLNDTLKNESVFTKLEWEENKTYLTIGNHASHGEYDEFDLTQVNKFYKHIQTLINKFNI